MAAIYGVVAGIVFATISWGVDAVRVLLAHGIYAWIPYLVGLVICSAIGGAAGWLAYRLNHFLTSFLLWLLVGICFSWLASHLSLDLYGRMLDVVNPALGHMVQYQDVSGTQARSWIIEVAVIGLTTIAGLLEISLADSTISSPGAVGRYFAMVFWVILFLLPGLAVENNLTGMLSAPVVATDQLIQYAEDHPRESLAHPTQTDLRLGALLDIQPWLHEPRQLILQGYDGDLYNTTVLVHFQTGWAVCSLSSNQPVYCKPYASPPAVK